MLNKGMLLGGERKAVVWCIKDPMFGPNGALNPSYLWTMEGKGPIVVIGDSVKEVGRFSPQYDDVVVLDGEPLFVGYLPHSLNVLSVNKPRAFFKTTGEEIFLYITKEPTKAPATRRP